MPLPATSTALSSGHTTAHDAVADVQAYFGAVGDGVTDDAAAISAAITAAGVGGKVLFPKPTAKYLTSTTLTPLAGQHWIGGGHQHFSLSTAYPWIAYSGTGTAVNIGTADGVVLEGLRIECTNNTGTVAGVAIADESEWCVIERCSIIGPAKGTGTGLLLSGESIANAFHSIRDTSFRFWNLGARFSGFANSNRMDMTTFHSCTTAIGLNKTGADTKGGDNNFFSMIELDSSCTNGVAIADNATRNAFIRISDDGVTGIALSVTSGCLDTSFYNCHFVTAISDTSSGLETYYFNCSGVDPAGGAAMDVRNGYVDMPEIAAPAAPATNRMRLYCRDNGSGKTQAVVRFPTGATQVMATEP